MPAIRYLVDDVDAALAFYRLLGFKLIERWGPPFAIVRRKGLRVWLSGPGTSAHKPLGDGSVPAPGGWNRLVVEVKNLDKAIAKFSARGAKFRSQPIDGPGGRQVLIEDPSGNLIELFEPRREVE
jgi:catechol 2,3-dioxygenase-like lactoylglutathione lyase family enzyme